MNNPHDPPPRPDEPRPRDDWQDLRRRLFTPPEAVDDALCRSIMQAVARTAQAPPAPAAIRLRTLLAVGAAAAVLTMLVGHWFDSSPAPEAPMPAVALIDEEPATDPTDLEDAFQALAHVLTQQTLLQRDARKIGAHLRENVILFQPDREP